MASDASSSRPQTPADRPVTPGSGSPGYLLRPKEPPRARVTIQAADDDSGVTTFIEVPERGTSSISSVFTLCNSAIGAGVLSLPYAFHCAGLLGCLLLCVVLATCEGFTLYVLAKFAERYQASSYGQLIRSALGKKLSASMSAIMLVYLFGSCVAYMVIIGDTFSALGATFFGDDSLLADRRVVLAGAASAIALMCLPRDLSALEYVSVAAVGGFGYTSVTLLVRGAQIVLDRPDAQRFEGVDLFVWGPRALYAIPIIVFGFNSHPNVVTIFAELDQFPRVLARLPADPSAFASSAMGQHPLAPRVYTTKLIGMLGVIISAYAVIAAGYMAVGLAGYLAFPVTISSNVLNTFPDDLPIQIARGVIGLVVVGHFPTNHHPARAAAEDCLDALGLPPLPGWASPLFTLAFVGGTLGLSLAVADLGSVLHMVGGTAAAYMIFALPGLLCLDAAIIKHTTGGGPEADLQEPLLLPSAAGGSHQHQHQGAGAAANGQQQVLVDKRAGLREAGFIYSPRKSWWAGVCLVGLAVVVLAITLGTALAG